MASFDISGLFTNIPLIEAIDISTNLLDLLFYVCEFVYYNGCKFDKNNFCKSLSFVVNDNYFLFSYVQIDGIDMGSSLIKYFLNKQFNPVSSQDKETSKHIVMLSPPSIGSYSTVIRNNVNQLLKKHFPDCKLHIFFKPAVCLTPLFKPKDHFFLIHKDRYTLNSQQSSTPLVLFKYSMFFSYTVFPHFLLLFMFSSHDFCLIAFILYFSQLWASPVVMYLCLMAFFYVIPHRLPRFILACPGLFLFISPILCIHLCTLSHPICFIIPLYASFHILFALFPFPMPGSPSLHIRFRFYFLSHTDDDSS